MNLGHQFGFLRLHLYLHLEVSGTAGGHAAATQPEVAAADGGRTGVEAQVQLATARRPQLAGERASVASTSGR